MRPLALIGAALLATLVGVAAACGDPRRPAVEEGGDALPCGRTLCR
ncbi:hypothetical protein [Caldimonas sp. KR1-144]